MNRKESAKKDLQTMLFYYITALIDEGESDPKRVIATEICEMIQLSEEQFAYVMAKQENSIDISEQLDSAAKLLKNSVKKDKVDMEAVKIVRELLTVTSKQIKDAYDKYIIGDSDDGEDREESEQDGSP
jgi:hypothetical protein